ncbi:hypothetical protein [uncultured Prevotella sp.]|uniref:hypothetical protein n=1 Tax=uncultured Prevotella sp. TaxID=159272 RepID=UPI002615FECE|nr:hypothetical protein [uncultured Prevotella sp.]
MDKNFDFNQVGKRMPYSTPDDFFAKMQSNILDAVQDSTPKNMDYKANKRHVRKMLWPVSLSAAAAVAAMFVISMHLFSPKPSVASCSMHDVEQAFTQLSESDQTYILDVYQDDVFLNY